MLSRQSQGPIKMERSINEKIDGLFTEKKKVAQRNIKPK